MRIINNYITSTNTLLDKLKNSLAQPDLQRAIKNRLIPQQGHATPELEYRFHGTGCWISDGVTSVDFEFLPDGKTNGFDAWRLRHFAADNDLNIQNKSERDFQEALRALLEEKTIEVAPGSHQYRLAATTVRQMPNNSPTT